MATATSTGDQSGGGMNASQSILDRFAQIKSDLRVKTAEWQHGNLQDRFKGENDAAVEEKAFGASTPFARAFQGDIGADPTSAAIKATSGRMSQEVLQARLGNKFLEYKLRDHQEKVARDEKAQNGGGGGGGDDEDGCGEGGGGNGGGSGHHYAATNVSISKSFFGEWEGANTSRSTAKLKLQLGDVDGARADFATALGAEGKIHSDWAGQAAFLCQRGKLKVMMGEKADGVGEGGGGGGFDNSRDTQGQAALERLWDDAGADLDSAAAIYSKAQDKDGEATTLAVSAQLKWDRGYATGARACLDNAVALFRYVGNRQGESGCLLKRASFSAEMGQGDEALEDLELALTAFRVIHDAKAEAETLLSMGGVKLQLGLIEAGIGDLESAAAICQRIHNHHLEAKAIQMLVDVKMRLQDVNAAVTNLSCGLACREV